MKVGSDARKAQGRGRAPTYLPSPFRYHPLRLERLSSNTATD